MINTVNVLETPSLALKTAHAIRKLIVLSSTYTVRKDAETTTNVNNFRVMFDSFVE